MEIKIRPHHGLCIAFFQGKGYSSAFIQNMEHVIAQLAENPLIRIGAEQDAICRACPNLQDGICRDEKQVSAYDRAVLELCGIEAGTVLDWQSFARNVNTKIFQAGRRADICADCQWNAVCAAFDVAQPSAE